MKKLMSTTLGVVLLTGCGEDAEMQRFATDDIFLHADAVVIQGEHFFQKDGIRSAHLVFDTAFQWRDSVNTALRGVDLTVYEEGLGTERAHVQSLRGTMDQRGERLSAEGDVVLFVRSQNRRIRTQELHYDPHSEQMWSDSAFVMEHQGQTTRGRSFRTDTEFRNFRIVGTAN